MNPFKLLRPLSYLVGFVCQPETTLNPKALNPKPPNPTRVKVSLLGYRGECLDDLGEVGGLVIRFMHFYALL